MKKYLKFIVIYLGYLFHRNRKSKIIYYHDVGLNYTDMGTSFDIIKKHISISQSNNFIFVTSINNKKNQIMICFDDGWKGLYDYKDFFVTQRIFPTVFVAVELIGTKGHMTLKELNELSLAGFNIQGHGWKHIDLTTVQDEKLDVELVSSKRKLEEDLNHEIDSICFPLGRFSRNVVKESLKAGYKQVYSSIWGDYYKLSEQGLICRCFCQDIPPVLFKYVLLGDSVLMRLNSKLHHIERENGNSITN